MQNITVLFAILCQLIQTANPTLTPAQVQQQAQAAVASAQGTLGN